MGGAGSGKPKIDPDLIDRAFHENAELKIRALELRVKALEEKSIQQDYADIAQFERWNILARQVKEVLMVIREQLKND